MAWRSVLRWSGISVGVLLAAAVLVLAIGLYTPPGRQAIAFLVKPLTGGTVAVYGLSGSLPDHLHIDRVELRDARGTWLRIDDLKLDWDAFAALRNLLVASHAHAANASLLRWPISAGNQSRPTFDFADLAIKRIDLGAAAFGHAARLTASGSLHYNSATDTRANILAARLDGFGNYRIDGVIAGGRAQGHVDIAERNDGIVGGLLGVPDIGPVNLRARAAIEGTRNSLSLWLAAGPLLASAEGFFDLKARAAQLAFSANAPAMHPHREVSWQSLSAKGFVRGSLDRPRVNATIDIENGLAFGFATQALRLQANGAAGTVTLAGTAERLTVPGANPDVFAANPVTLSAEVNLAGKLRPMRFALKHPLVQMVGAGTMAGLIAADATVRLPTLAPFAAAMGAAFGGSATLNVRASRSPTGALLTQVAGTIAPGGADLAAKLLGSKAALNISAAMTGGALQSVRGSLSGADLKAQLQGSGTDRTNYRWRIALPDLSRLASNIRGSAAFEGDLTGSPGNLRATAKGSADIGTRTLAKARIAFEASANGLPRTKAGDVRVSGRLAGAPVTLLGKLSRESQGLRIVIQQGTWKSLHLSGDLVAASATSGKGAVAARLDRLADLAPFIGSISGSLDARATIGTRNGDLLITPHVAAKKMHYASIAADRIDLSGDIVGLSRPTLALKLTAGGLASQDFGGNAELSFKGSLDRLTLHAASKLSANGTPMTLTADANADATARRMTLRVLNASWRGQALALSAPATIDFAKGFSVDAFRARIGTGSLILAGSVTPRLALMAAVTGLALKTMQPILPLALEGTLSANANFSGALAEPAGDINVWGRNLRMHEAPSGAPASSLDAHVLLQRKVMTINATLSGGKTLQLTARGRVPIDADKPIAIAANGSADLGLLGASLAASGQSLQGNAIIDMNVAGTRVAPRATGSLKIANGEFRDFTRGLRLTNIHGLLEAQGTSIRVADFTAAAGTGTMSGSGTIDLATPGIPVNLAIRARDARPIASDLLNATLRTDLHLTGKLGEGVTLRGDVRVLKADVNVPDKFPPNVAELDVRRGKRSASVPPPPRHEIALDLTVSSPGQVFVRGRGLDAEFAGELKVAGTSAAPQVLGALDMRRGTLSLAGTTLDFQSGKIGFDGASLRNRLDPTFDFVAQTISGGVTATLNLTGYASAPKVQLTSMPSLPQDEIMARLLFQQSMTQLSAIQIAEIADAIASLSGSGLNPVGSLRKSLGLDRLAVGSATSASSGNAGTTVEAGKYVARNVYVGTTQNLSGGTRAVVQVDITKHLKAQAAVGMGLQQPAGAPTTPAQDTGDSVGLSYQFEY